MNRQNVIYAGRIAYRGIFRSTSSHIKTFGDKAFLGGVRVLLSPRLEPNALCSNDPRIVAIFKEMEQA